MATLKIYRDNTELVEVNIGDDTIRESYFMGDDRVRVSFSYPEIIDFLPYDYIIHNGKRYSIKGNEMPSRKEYGKRRFDYDVVFKSPEYRMHDMPLSHLGESKFDYFGTPSQILALVIDCMSVIDDGFVLEIDEPADIEPLHIYFDNVTCRQAVTQACELFGLEYNFDGHVLYVGKSVGNRLEGFTFSQGKGNGLYTLTEVSVPDSPFATRFYGFGGSENLPLDYKSGRKNLVMTGEFVERNIDLYGLIVQNVYFDDIFPTRTGALTAVSSDFLTLTDTSIDFDLNDQQMEGAKIVFMSGELGGQEFEIASYDHATKAMRINRLEESEGYFLPNDTFSPKVGDKYKLVGIIMPESYITAAENKVAEKTIEYAEKHSHPSVGFELELDELELRRRGLVGQLNVGTWIHVVSTKLSVDRYLRITELSYPLANPSKITAKISDVVSYTLAERILKDVSGNKNEIAAIEREQKRDFSILSRKSAEQAKLQAERLNELREYIFDADNYFDATKIKPQSIETQMLSVGAKSQNFYLSGVTMQPNYLGDANRFYVSAGQLQHREISIDSGFIWNLTAQAFYALEPNKTYYLSAKCSKSALTATFTLSDTPKSVESEAGYYDFNIGVLYPIGADGKRYFANTSGVSYVVGSQITTGRLKSLDGNTWFDLDTGEIRGAIKFTSGQTVESAIEQAKGEAVAQSGVNIQQVIAALSVGGRNLLKSSVYNLPVSTDGTSNVIKEDNEFIVNIIPSRDNGYIYFYPRSVMSKVLDVFKPLIFSLEVFIPNDSTIYNINLMIPDSNEHSVNLPVTEKGKWVQMSFKFSLYKELQSYFYIKSTANTNGQVFRIRNFQVEEGNMVSPWKPAPEDFEQQIIDTDNARKSYVDAQDNLKEVEVKAYADGIVSAEEQRAIADATAKANTAKAYAESQDLLLKAQTDAYADGKVSAEEQARIAQAQANLTAAQNYAEAQDNLAKIETKAYADGIVDAEEERAIADAQTKLNEAKNYAESQASQAQINAITASSSNIANAINALSIGGRNLVAKSKMVAGYLYPYSGNLIDLGDFHYDPEYYTADSDFYYYKNYTKSDGMVGYILWYDENKNFISSSFQGWDTYESLIQKPQAVKFYRINVANLTDKIKIEKGNKATDWTPAPEDIEKLVIDTDNARKAYIDAQDDLKETQTKAYADGKVSAEEARAIADATAKSNAAKSYAEAQDLLLKAQTDAYADGKVSAEESARITQAQENLTAAQNYAEAQDNLAKIETKAYADGIVDAEEQRAIADATAKANAAKSYADAQDILLKAQADAYADGKVSAEESARIAQAQANLTAAQNYAEAQDNLAKIETKAYADGVVDAEEARAIADAQAKLNEAKSHADSQALQAQANAISSSNSNIANAINALSVGGRNLLKSDVYNLPISTDGTSNVVKDGNEFTVNIPQTSEQGYVYFYPRTVISKTLDVSKPLIFSLEVFIPLDSTIFRLNLIISDSSQYSVNIPVTEKGKWVQVSFKFSLYKELDGYFYIKGIASTNGQFFRIRNFKVEEGNMVSPWSPAPEDLQKLVVDTDNARKSYIDAQDTLKETQIKAYADGIVSAEEARAIADATAKANAAKSYADNLKVQTETYINSVATPIKNVVEEWTYAETTEIDGNKLRAGTVTADKINTLNLQARHIATSDNVDKLTINANNDNSIKIRHANGQVGIQMGLVGGVPKLVFFNEYGNKVWEGGMSGIVYVDNVPESWSPAIFKLLPGNHSNVVPDVNGNITSSEKEQLKNWINTSSGFLTTDFDGQPVISSGTTFYSYSAGINAQAENNRIYEGLHTSQLKSTGNWMPNGWYGQSGTALYQVSEYPVQVYATTLEYYANGKMIASILIDDITML